MVLAALTAGGGLAALSASHEAVAAHHGNNGHSERAFPRPAPLRRVPDQPLAASAVVSSCSRTRRKTVAVDQFEAAHDLEVSNLVTWMAYLRHSLPVLARLMAIETTDDLQERIVDDWLRFYSQVSAVAASSDATQGDLRTLRRRFEAIETDTV